MNESGSDNSQSIKNARRLQQDMLQQLAQHPSIDPLSYVGLEYCRPNHCARLGCAEACWFGNRRRSLEDIRAIERLLQPFDGPLYEVRIIRGVWARPFGMPCSAAASRSSWSSPRKAACRQ
jgi:hypothetical protein